MLLVYYIDHITYIIFAMIKNFLNQFSSYYIHEILWLKKRPWCYFLQIWVPAWLFFQNLRMYVSFSPIIYFTFEGNPMRNMIRECQLLVIFYFFCKLFILSTGDLVLTTPIIDGTPMAASTVEYMIVLALIWEFRGIFLCLSIAMC